MHAHRRAQILQQRHAILAAEIHKLHRLEVGVKVHTFALGVVTLLGTVQVMYKESRQLLNAVRDSLFLHIITSNFHQRRNGLWPLLDEANDQRVVPEAQLFQIDEVDQILGEGLQVVVMEKEGPEVGEVCELLGEVSDLVVAEHQSCETSQLAELHRKFFQVIAAQVQIVKPKNMSRGEREKERKKKISYLSFPQNSKWLSLLLCLTCRIASL